MSQPDPQTLQRWIAYLRTLIPVLEQNPDDAVWMDAAAVLRADVRRGERQLLASLAAREREHA